MEAAEGSVDELIMSGTAFGVYASPSSYSITNRHSPRIRVSPLTSSPSCRILGEPPDLLSAHRLFNLVFSLLPAKIRGVVGFLGFASDRKLALRALAVSAARADVHGVFAGYVCSIYSSRLWIVTSFPPTRLALMTYHGVVLLLAGYQADEAQIIRQYRAIVDRCALFPSSVTASYITLTHAHTQRLSALPCRLALDSQPSACRAYISISAEDCGSSCVGCATGGQAKILRMSFDAEGAIQVLQDGLAPGRPHTFVQADGLVSGVSRTDSRN